MPNNINEDNIDNKAAALAAKFIARAVNDDLLPPVFLSDAEVYKLSPAVILAARAWLATPHAGQVIEHIWG
jgi:hypothetical protein